jgi:predicted transcriptional regulator
MAEQDTLAPSHLLSLATEIVAAYVANNATSRSDLTGMIGTVHAALSELAAFPVAAAVDAPLRPAVSAKKSISPDILVCIECGKRFQSLRRHLSTSHALTPEAYRAKWSLGAEYPMVAPAYSTRRSELAKESGLGRKIAPMAPAAKRGKK